MSTHAYTVDRHDLRALRPAVTEELAELDGVTDVDVDLVAGGTSTVTVTSDARRRPRSAAPMSRRRPAAEHYLPDVPAGTRRCGA